MTPLPEFRSVQDLRFGQSPGLDAWLLHFLTENELEHSIAPRENASPEQLRFMVFLDENQVFAPCSDRMLRLLLHLDLHSELRAEYDWRWKKVAGLVEEFVPDAYTRERILTLCRHKFRMVEASPIIIPSRMLKRFVTIFLTQSGLTDPHRALRREYNTRAAEVLASRTVDRLLNICPEDAIACHRLSDLRFDLDMIELERLMVMSTMSGFWLEPGYTPDFETLKAETLAVRDDFRHLRRAFGQAELRSLKILYLPDDSGGLMFDLLIVRALLRQGHRVTLAIKNGFYFTAPAFWDWESDPALALALEGAHFLAEERITKNDLLKTQREHPFLVISDGTREDLNLYRTSVTFSRAWKEADLVMAKGSAHRRRLIETGQHFTRDVVCFDRDPAGRFRLAFKPRPAEVRKFPETALLGKAEEIIAEMRRAKAAGRSVMFYSAVIGSLPGQTRTAIEVVTAFVAHLRTRLDKTFIINPAEHFEEGMDADDLMYMWEQVQRSGLLDVWRFQSVADIEQSFDLLHRKVPPIWAGKDSTFSTGCTKEMTIALDMQRRTPEMQILGPSPEKFFRRREYGVGKFSDAVLG